MFSGYFSRAYWAPTYFGPAVTGDVGIHVPPMAVEAVTARELAVSARTGATTKLPATLGRPYALDSTW
jgi:hypothetical protein